LINRQQESQSSQPDCGHKAAGAAVAAAAAAAASFLRVSPQSRGCVIVQSQDRPRDWFLPTLRVLSICSRCWLDCRSSPVTAMTAASVERYVGASGVGQLLTGSIVPLRHVSLCFCGCRSLHCCWHGCCQGLAQYVGARCADKLLGLCIRHFHWHGSRPHSNAAAVCLNRSHSR
jgi:hypothetical protein